MDRQSDERCRVVGDDVVVALGEGLLQDFHAVLDPLGGIERVGARRQADGHARGRLAVVLGLDLVVFGAHLDARHIAEMDDGAVVVAQDDVPELVDIGQARLRRDGGVQHRARHCRQAAQLAGRNLRVLGADGGHDVGRRQGEAVELVRVQPDAHGVLGAEQLGFTDAVDARQVVEDVGGDIVAEVGIGRLRIVAVKADDQQEVARRLVDAHALLLDFLRQQGQGGLQLVLHLDLGDIDVGAGVEGQGHRRGAVRIGRRVDIEQVVDALHVLLDDLRHRILGGLGRGAGIDGLDRDLRQGDFRILRNRQVHDRQDARHHDDDGHHPREDGTMNEETRDHAEVLESAGRTMTSG